jgi:phosphate transport system substrate-binding protein
MAMHRSSLVALVLAGLLVVAGSPAFAATDAQRPRPIPPEPAGDLATMYRGEAARTGEFPGPGLQGAPAFLWRVNLGEVWGTPGVGDGLVVPRFQDGLIAASLAVPSVRVAAGQATPDSATKITAAGSATAGPILTAAAEAFAAEEPDVSVDVERTNSGDGIARFCAGEIDIATSGRQIREAEAGACAEAGIAYDEYEVAYDGVAVVVHPDNAAFSCLTVEQLGALWAPESTVATWADLDPAWPTDPIGLYGTGESSGTYQFFTQVTVGEEGVSRDDYNVTEGHPETAEGVAGDPNGLGFLPYPRYVENQDRLKLVAVDGGEGCVEPSPEAIRDGRYAPLARPLYVYVKRESLKRPEVQEYLRFWFAGAAGFAEEAGLVASQDEVYEANLEDLEAAIAGASEPDGPATPSAARRS